VKPLATVANAVPAVDRPDPSALTKVPLFAGLTDDELARTADWLEVDEYDAGRLLTRTNEAGYTFFILETGRVHAELHGQVLGVYEPGAVFGEMAFFDPRGRRRADVVCDSPVRVFSMFGTHFREMQQCMPVVAARLKRLFEERAARHAALGHA
jgi:CRP/FNR family transcriptional regulator